MRSSLLRSSSLLSTARRSTSTFSTGSLPLLVALPLTKVQPLLYSDISDTFASSNLTASLPEALEGLRDTLQNYDVKRSFATLGLELGGGVTLGIKM